MMNSIRQVGLLPAGCQPWYMDIVSMCGSRFAYCSTLAVYIYERSPVSHAYQLHSIVSEHKKTITAIAWHSSDSELLASAGEDKCAIVWHIGEQRLVARVEALTGPPTAIAWYSPDPQCLLIGIQKGPLLIWRYSHGNSLSTPKEYGSAFSAEITVCRFSECCPGKLAIGHVDGSLSLILPGNYYHKNVLRPLASKDDTSRGSDSSPVWDLRWDPCSSDYLLFVRHGPKSCGGGVYLVDVNTPSIIISYVLPSTAVSTQAIAWIPGAAGMFLTGDKEVGVFRLWNVSKTTPLENIKINKTGFHALCILASDYLFSVKVEGSPALAPDGYSAVSSKPSNSSKLVTRQSRHRGSRTADGTGEKWLCPPMVYALCTFMDGGVGLYDIAGRKWTFLREYGHVETIFDCKFKPDDAGGSLLATASFDGTIKVWDVETMAGVCSSAGNEGVIYQISWAPADLDCIAAATARHGAFIWDLQKQIVVTRFDEHGAGGCVYSVAWNQRESRRIATGGADGLAIVRQVDGKLVSKYKHPGAVFSCDWSPTNKDMLLTSCEDGCVRMYYIATGGDQPLKSFSGHSAKAFMVKWSPVKDGVFCSGSDDKSLRVWDYSQDSSVCVLAGHTGPVRGLCWNTEVPHLLCSGSWDCTIRIWDIRDGACIGVLADHGGDVYGLASGPRHPFVLASSSRDSTLRLWSLLPLVHHLELRVLARCPWNQIFANSNERSPGCAEAALLCGRQSRELKLEVTDVIDTTGHEAVLRKFSHFFMYPGGVQNLWDLVSVQQGQAESNLSSNYGKAKGVVHRKHLAKYKLSTAQQLEMSRSLRSSTKLSAVKDDKLAEAADIYIRLGNVRRYCEIMVELGQWHKALAIAPGVSFKYWQSLMKRYTDSLMALDPRGALPFCLASGQHALAIGHLLELGAHDEAMLVSSAASDGCFESHHRAGADSASTDRTVTESTAQPGGDTSMLIDAATEQAAVQHMSEGLPVMAACRYLAADRLAEAVACLVKGNELALAVSISQNLVGTTCYTEAAGSISSMAAAHLALRCERLGMWDLALDVLRACALNYEKEAAKVCIRCSASILEIQALHEKAGLPSMQECGQETATPNTDTALAVRLLLLSDSPIKGIELALQIVKEKMASPNFCVTEVDDIMEYASCFPVEKLQKAKYGKLRAELLALSAYKGALTAVRRSYDGIVVPLLGSILDLMRRETANCVGFPFTAANVTDELSAWRAFLSQNVGNHSAVVERLLKKSGKNKENSRIAAGAAAEVMLSGPDCVTGSQLPSHSDVHTSIFSGTRIKGPVFLLEDGKSAISLNEALMWAKVNPYSPLNSGVHINPF